MQIVDMHCDTISELLCAKREGKPHSLRENQLHADLLRMRESGYILQNFALFINLRKCINHHPWEELLEQYELYREELADNTDLVAPVTCFADLECHRRAGVISAMLTVEEGGVCGGDLHKLEELYALGVRMLTLSWNYSNELGHPNIQLDKEPDLYRPESVPGLTKRGFEFVECMEAFGMVIDVSHLSDAGFYDVASCSKKPFVASHSNARAVCACSRNLTDDMIRLLAQKGGCMGLNYCADFLVDPKGRSETVDYWEAVASHAKHIVNVGGIEVLGLGSDFDGIPTNRDIRDVTCMERLWEAFGKAGFTQGEREKIFEKNVLRIYREIL